MLHTLLPEGFALVASLEDELDRVLIVLLKRERNEFDVIGRDISIR